jgi:hypothetical protein
MLCRASGATETWIRPLSDYSFAVVLVNKGDIATDGIVYFDQQSDQTWGTGEDFFPAVFSAMHVRDIGNHIDIGVYHSKFIVSIPPRDAVIYKLTPSIAESHQPRLPQVFT